MCIVCAVFLRWRLRRRAHSAAWVFGPVLGIGGIERFLVEFLRAKDDRVLGPFTIAQATSVVMVLVGALILSRWSRPDGFQPPAEAKILQREAGG